MNFNSAGIVTKPSDERVASTVSQLVSILHDLGLQVVLDVSSPQLPEQQDLPRHPIGQLGEYCDVVIVVGGDGTLLAAARNLARQDVPLIGVNLGRLGYLVDVSPEKMQEILAEMLDGNYIEEERFLLDCSTEMDGKITFSGTATNEVVIHKWDIARMIEVETHINNRLVNRQRCDGLIVSTPTGSTAYALSGGGPIIEPSLDVIELVPICPHTLSNRPLMVKADSDIDILVTERDNEHVRITLDGQMTHTLTPGCHININRHPFSFQLLHPESYDPYSIMRAKLGWS